jgi:4-carboxymuconolactone decarboxylase
VPAQTETLGGRLPLLDPSTLSIAQKETYERLNRTWIRWASGVPFQSKLDDGRLIGPFNPILFSPAISSSFLDLQETEQKNTSLSQRVRQVVILAVGADGNRTTSFTLMQRRPERPASPRRQSEC